LKIRYRWWLAFTLQKGLSFSWQLTNVRELAQAIEKSMLLKGGRDIQVEDVIEYCDPCSERVFTHKGSASEDQTGKLNISDSENKVTALIKSKNDVTRAYIQNELGIGSTAAWKLLKTMREKGLIQKVDAGKSVRYALPE